MLYSAISPWLGIQGMALWLGGQRRGKFGKFCHSGRVTGKLCITDDVLHVHSCETGSAYVSGCKVDGRIARAASWVFSYSISGHTCFYKLRKGRALSKCFSCLLQPHYVLSNNRDCRGHSASEIEGGKLKLESTKRIRIYNFMFLWMSHHIFTILWYMYHSPFCLFLNLNTLKCI